jgi:hypothetical protein
MPTDPSPSFEVNLNYFSPSGKWKYSGTYTSSRKLLYEIWDEVRGLQVLGQLPGLQSGLWDGPISVDVPSHPHAHPHLIL